jgi:hypothetical protein
VEKVFFSKSKKGDGVICKTGMGKISFVDHSYKGIMPKEGEKWAVEIKKELDKVNIVLPLFRVDALTAVENLLKLSGYTLRLDFFNAELVVYEDRKEFRRFPYDGRWNEKMFYSYYLFPEAIRLHKLARDIVESGKTALVVDNQGKLVYLYPNGVRRNLHEYGYHSHIHAADGDEKNFAFANDEAEEKWKQLLAKNKAEFLEKMVWPPADYWNSDKIATAIGIPDRNRITIQVPQKMIGCSEWNNSYHEVTAMAKTSYGGWATEGTVCQVCGASEKAEESSYTVYYEHRGRAGSADHKGLGKCPHCGSFQDQLWGREGGEITDLPNFPDRDGGSRAAWKTAEEETYRFPYEDNDLAGELVVTVLPEVGATYLQKYKIWNIKSRVMHISKVKRKCMRPNFVASSHVEIPGRGPGSLNLKRRHIAEEAINFEKAEFPADFTLPERYVCGWLPQDSYYQEKEGAYSLEDIHREICGFLADTSEYFAEDVPQSLASVKEILQSMMAIGYIKFLPSEKEMVSLYHFFKKDWEEFNEGEDDPAAFPSEEEWIGKKEG